MITWRADATRAIFKEDALASQGVDVWCLDYRISHEPESGVMQIIANHNQ